jgi:hypothetical protein
MRNTWRRIAACGSIAAGITGSIYMGTASAAPPAPECWGGLVSMVAQRDASAFGQGTAAFAQANNGAGAAISSYTTTTNCGGQ